MYMLVQEPSSSEARRAFEALDDTFGTESFDKGSAQRVLAEHGFNKGILDMLISTGCIEEV